MTTAEDTGKPVFEPWATYTRDIDKRSPKGTRPGTAQQAAVTELLTTIRELAEVGSEGDNQDHLIQKAAERDEALRDFLAFVAAAAHDEDAKKRKLWVLQTTQGKDEHIRDIVGNLLAAATATTENAALQNASTAPGPALRSLTKLTLKEDGNTIQQMAESYALTRAIAGKPLGQTGSGKFADWSATAWMAQPDGDKQTVIVDKRTKHEITVKHSAKKGTTLQTEHQQGSTFSQTKTGVVSLVRGAIEMRQTGQWPSRIIHIGLANTVTSASSKKIPNAVKEQVIEAIMEANAHGMATTFDKKTNRYLQEGMANDPWWQINNTVATNPLRARLWLSDGSHPHTGDQHTEYAAQMAKLMAIVSSASTADADADADDVDTNTTQQLQAICKAYKHSREGLPKYRQGDMDEHFKQQTVQALDAIGHHNGTKIDAINKALKTAKLPQLNTGAPEGPAAEAADPAAEPGDPLLTTTTAETDRRTDAIAAAESGDPLLTTITAETNRRKDAVAAAKAIGEGTKADVQQMVVGFTNTHKDLKRTISDLQRRPQATDANRQEIADRQQHFKQVTDDLKGLQQHQKMVDAVMTAADKTPTASTTQATAALQSSALGSTTTDMAPLITLATRNTGPAVAAATACATYISACELIPRIHEQINTTMQKMQTLTERHNQLTTARPPQTEAIDQCKQQIAKLEDEQNKLNQAVPLAKQRAQEAQQRAAIAIQQVVVQRQTSGQDAGLVLQFCSKNLQDGLKELLSTSIYNPRKFTHKHLLTAMEALNAPDPSTTALENQLKEALENKLTEFVAGPKKPADADDEATTILCGQLAAVLSDRPEDRPSTAGILQAAKDFSITPEPEAGPGTGADELDPPKFSFGALFHSSGKAKAQRAKPLPPELANCVHLAVLLCDTTAIKETAKAYTTASYAEATAAAIDVQTHAAARAAAQAAAQDAEENARAAAQAAGMGERVTDDGAAQQRKLAKLSSALRNSYVKGPQSATKHSTEEAIHGAAALNDSTLQKIQDATAQQRDKIKKTKDRTSTASPASNPQASGQSITDLAKSYKAFEDAEKAYQKAQLVALRRKLIQAQIDKAEAEIAAKAGTLNDTYRDLDFDLQAANITEEAQRVIDQTQQAVQAAEAAAQDAQQEKQHAAQQLTDIQTKLATARQTYDAAMGEHEVATAAVAQATTIVKIFEKGYNPKQAQQDIAQTEAKLIAFTQESQAAGAEQQTHALEELTALHQSIKEAKQLVATARQSAKTQESTPLTERIAFNLDANRLHATAKAKTQKKRLTTTLQSIATQESELSGGAKDDAQIDILKCRTVFSQAKRRLAHQELVLAILEREDAGIQEQKMEVFNNTTTVLNQALQQEHAHYQRKLQEAKQHIEDLKGKNEQQQGLVGDTTTLEEAQAKQLDAESKAQAIEVKADSIKNHIEKHLLPQEHRMKEARTEAKTKASEATQALSVIQQALDKQKTLTEEIEELTVTCTEYTEKLALLPPDEPDGLESSKTAMTGAKQAYEAAIAALDASPGGAAVADEPSDRVDEPDSNPDPDPDAGGAAPPRQR